MLAALLLAGLVAAPVSSAALFVPVRPRRRVAGTWPATRRLVLALLGTVLLAAVVAAVLHRAARDPDQRGRRRRRRGRDEPAVAAGDPALERPRPPVLGRQPVPVRLVPGLHPAVDADQRPRRLRHRRRPGAVGAGAARRGAGLRVPLGALRRARHRAVAPADHPGDAAGGAARRPAVREPARAGPQRAAGHGDRDADLAAAAGLPELRGRGHRRQHRRRGTVAAGRRLVHRAPGHVLPPGRLAGLQVRGAQRGAARDTPIRGPSWSAWSTPTTSSTRTSCAAARRCSPTSGSASSRRRRTTGTGRRRRTSAGSTTRTSTSSRSRSRPGTSTTAPSSPARWGSSAAARWSRSAAGTSGASPRTPSCPSGCCGPAGPGCTWTTRTATA